jgi:hypothetical protein
MSAVPPMCLAGGARSLRCRLKTPKSAGPSQLRSMLGYGAQSWGVEGSAQGSPKGLACTPKELTASPVGGWRPPVGRSTQSIRSQAAVDLSGKALDRPKPRRGGFCSIVQSTKVRKRPRTDHLRCSGGWLSSADPGGAGYGTDPNVKGRRRTRFCHRSLRLCPRQRMPRRCRTGSRLRRTGGRVEPNAWRAAGRLVNLLSSIRV